MHGAGLTARPVCYALLSLSLLALMQMQAPPHLGALAVEGLTYKPLPKDRVLSLDGKTPVDVSEPVALALAEHGCVPVGPGATAAVIDRAAQQVAARDSAIAAIAARKKAFLEANPHLSEAAWDAFKDRV